jgi:hypothetical protein
MIKYTFLFLLTLSACTMQKQVGYFEVSPYAQVKSDKLNQPLYLKYGNRVLDTYQIKEGGFSFTATQLHKTYAFANGHAYGDLFSDVKLFAQNDIGFILEMQQMEYSWSYNEVKKKDSMEYLEPVCTLKYASSLYRNELLLSQSVGTIAVRQRDVNEYASIDQVFKETVKRSLAAMAQQHFDKMK